MYQVDFFEDSAAFFEQVSHLLEQDETRNSLILGIVSQLTKNIHAYGEQSPLMALVRDQDSTVCVSAVMTPPFAMIVQSEPLCLGGLESLADALLERGVILPGVNGLKEVSDAFAELWKENTGQQARILTRLRSYELRKVEELDFPPGSLRVAKESDAPLAEEMLQAMAEEAVAGPHPPSNQERLLPGIRAERLFFWEDEGQIVSVGMANRPLTHSINVSGVYTLPDFRRKGYARALVAEISKRMLAQGYEIVHLFTDLANPTSNKIYQEIGFRPVCDYHQYEFFD